MLSANEELKELKAIKKLLVLIALKNGANSDEVDAATGMGAGNVRALFPIKKRDKIPGLGETRSSTGE